jgi:hypothetical protein
MHSNSFKKNKYIKYEITIILVLFLTISCQNSQAIFQENGDDWITEGNAYWNFSKDELTGKVNDEVGFVMTKNTYKDFVLELEFEPDSSINSGIFIRCKKHVLYLKGIGCCRTPIGTSQNTRLRHFY